MIKSMTAFARSEVDLGQHRVAVEVRSYNSRYLDLVVRMPQSWQPLEEKIKSRVTATVVRGRVELRFELGRQLAAEPEAFEPNSAKARGYYRALEDLRAALGIEAPVTIEQVLAAGDVIRPVERETTVEEVWPVLQSCLDGALGELDAMRCREGEFIARDIEHRLDAISRHLEHIRQESYGLLDDCRKRLQERIAALTRGVVELDSDRIAQEAAFLAARSDITEETVRAASHLEQFASIMKNAEAAGRKLNFLLQELNREFNTIGSKTEKSTVAHTVVEVKAELEKIREQVQNIE
jgi:uncharacterized protein (TIGR00255 family)